MRRYHTLRTVLLSDARRVVRDRFILNALLLFVGIALATRWALPVMREAVLVRQGLDITPWIPLGVSYFVVVNASMFSGLMGGFLLLEGKEERTVQAMLVTPASAGLPLWTLLSAVMVCSAGLCFLLSAIVGQVPPSVPAIIASAVVGAPTAAIIALIIATFASNKIEAFAVMKSTQIMGLAPVAAWFVPEPLQFLAGIFPMYWPSKIWWLSASGADNWLWLWFPAVASSSVWLVGLSHRYMKTAANAR